VVEYTNGQTMPVVRYAMFRTGQRGRPMPGYSPRVFASLEDVRKFLQNGKLSPFCPAKKRKPTIEIRFEGDCHKFWAHLVQTNGMVALTIPEFGTLLMVKARDKQALVQMPTMVDLPPDLYAPLKPQPPAPAPAPAPQKDFWPRPWARVLMFGLSEVNVQIKTELDEIPAPAKPLPTTLRQYFLSQVVVEMTGLMMKTSRPHLAMAIAIDMAERADRSAAKRKGEAAKIAMAAVDQANSWATDSPRLNEAAIAVMAAVEKELK
jgi:hypothetical protein